MKRLLAAAALLAATPAHAESVHPIKLPATDIAGAAFSRPDAETVDEGEGRKAIDALGWLSTDKKVNTGLYKAGPGRFEIKDGYGVDEFMYFLKGGVKLTSADGTVTEIKAGDAVTIPRDWKGVWESDGYEKIYVIVSVDKPIE